MNMKLDHNWTTDNNGYPLFDADVERYISIVPTSNQVRLAQKPFNIFVHFGMNTATGREWGNATEKAEDFNITKIDPYKWTKLFKQAGATGVILTCKHHDGFCLWPSEYTSFNVQNSAFHDDIVALVADACRMEGLDFGVYLSPWDMHEPRYATPEYNDYFCNQLTELLTNYGEIFEVWFDGAKGAEAKAFEYDWQRYYDLIRKLQPNANIAICGPDIRWIGNEAGKTRESEFSVVPEYLTKAETIEENSQKNEKDTAHLQKLDSKMKDLGSRKVLSKNAFLHWYPAEVDVSIRKGWFWSKKGNSTVKSVKKLMDIYYNSVGNNCVLLLNVPPTTKGAIHSKDARVLKKLGKKIVSITANPVIVKNFGKLKDTDGYLEFAFDSVKKLRHIVLSEDVTMSQRVEKFDIFIKKPNGKYKKVYAGTIIGSKKIIPLKEKAVGAVLVIRQSRSTPYLSQVGFYE